MRSGLRSMLAVAGAALAAACAPLPTVETEEARRVDRQPAVVRPGTPPQSDVESLLAYYQQVKGMSGAELGREHDTARQAYARSRTEFNRVRFAMMLSLPNTTFSDSGRALELLEPVSRNFNGPFHGLATLLVTHLQERKRLDASVQGLQQKLDALKSLERSMIERKR
jgi:hypothetical protein